jgi:FMN-dependent NADH-azoreductase
MTLFRLDTSIRTQGSVTRAVADTVQTVWQAEHPDARVIHRDLGVSPLPADAWSQATLGKFVAEEERTAEQIAAAALATALVDELLEADAFVFAIPLYNFGVAAAAKNWIDLIHSEPRVGGGAQAPFEGRPTVLVTARGGGYGPGTPREGWDHSTPYLRRIFSDVWKLDLHVAEAELTLAAPGGPMEALIPLAEESLRTAHEAATQHGKRVASLVRAAA